MIGIDNAYLGKQQLTKWDRYLFNRFDFINKDNRLNEIRYMSGAPVFYIEWISLWCMRVFTYIKYRYTHRYCQIVI